MTASRDEMWLRIREYVEACGGNVAGTDNHDQNQRRLLAVSRLDDIIRKLVLEAAVQKKHFHIEATRYKKLEAQVLTMLPYYLESEVGEPRLTAEDCVRFAAEELAALRVVVPKD